MPVGTLLLYVVIAGAILVTLAGVALVVAFVRHQGRHAARQTARREAARHAAAHATRATAAAAAATAKVGLHAPLVDALESASRALDRARVAWAEAAVDADAPSPAARHRALAEAVLLGAFWLVAAAGEWQFTAARLGGILGDPNAGASAQALSGLTAGIFVAAASTLMGTFLAAADHAPSPFILPAHRRPLRRVALAGLVGIALSSATLTIASLEAAAGVDDEVLLLTFWVSFVALVVLGTLVCGHVALRPLALLTLATAAWILWLPLRVALLVLRLVHVHREASAVRAAQDAAVAAQDAQTALDTLHESTVDDDAPSPLTVLAALAARVAPFLTHRRACPHRAAVTEVVPQGTRADLTAVAPVTLGQAEADPTSATPATAPVSAAYVPPGGTGPVDAVPFQAHDAPDHAYADHDEDKDEVASSANPICPAPMQVDIPAPLTTAGDTRADRDGHAGQRPAA